MDFNSEKFSPASLPELCAPRNKLLTKLTKNSGERLLYIKAPAGYGKTVITNLWLKENQVRHLWIALDAYDNNPELFYRVLCSAVVYAQNKSDTSEEIDITSMFSTSPIEHAMLLTSQITVPDNPVYIILDDLHNITQEDILQSLPYFIRRLPVYYRFIMLSRTDMPARLREIFGERTYFLGADDLAFSKSEVQELFRLSGHTLTPSETTSIMRQTDGWAIAVNTLAANGHLPDFAAENSNPLFRYMESQIWEPLSSKEKNMLLQICIVNEFSAELFRRLTSIRNSKQVIEQFLQKNLFLSRIGDNVYRFHAIFLDFLQQMLEKTTIDKKKLYKTAAQYYIEKGNLYTSRHYAILGDNFKFLSRQIYEESQYTGFANNRSISAYVNGAGVFIDKLSVDSCRKYPYLNISAVWYHYLTGNVPRMTEALDRLYASLKRIALLHSEFLELTFLVCTLDPRKKFMDMMQQFDKLPPIKMRKDGQQGASITVNMPFAHRCLRDYSEFSLYDDFDVILEPSAGLLLKKYFKVAMLLIKSGFAYEKNQWQEALALCEQAQLKTDDNTSDEVLFASLCHRWAALTALGKDTESLKVSAQIEKMLLEKDALYLMPNYKALKTDFALREGSRLAAEEWLNEYFVHQEEHLMLYRIYQYLTTIRALISLNRLEEAKNLCLRLRAMAHAYNREIDMAESDVLLAVCLYRQSQTDAAADTMLQAIQLLYQYHFIRPYSMEGASVIPVLKKCLSKIERCPGQYEFDRRYVNEIYIAAKEQATRRNGLPESGIPLKKLSKQQKKMIEYLAKGYTNADISNETGLAVPTVKTHLFLAYEKLGVSSAAEAVSKARELGFI